MARTVSGRKSAAKKAGRKGTAKSAAPVKKAAVKKAAVKEAGVKKAGVKKAGLRKVPDAKKTAAKKMAAPKQAAGKKKASGPKKAATRVAATRRTPARRVRPDAPARVAASRTKTAAPKTAATKTKPAAPQNFTVSHLKESDFKADGLRSYALYRDLGIATATGGLCQAHVLRLLSPCTDEVRQRHTHEVDLQLIYVLKGWIKNEFEGHGEQTMTVGSSWLQPPGIRHTVLDYSDDCEMLEIILPADFQTTEV